MKRPQDRKTYLNLQYGKFRGVGKYDIPILRKKDISLPKTWIGFNEVKTFRGKCAETGVHFFLDDYQFERVWNRPSAYVKMLSRFAVVATPDFSLYSDYPVAMQLWNHYRKQWLGAYFQYYGIVIIPTVSWSDKDSYDWCFDGIPLSSEVIISTVGLGKDREKWRLFHEGFSMMKQKLHPSYVLSYGNVKEGISVNEIISTRTQK